MTNERHEQVVLRCDAPGCDAKFLANSDRIREALRQAVCACWRHVPGRSAGPDVKDYCAPCSHLWSTS